MTNDPIQAWLNAAGRHPVLPKGEIIRLAKKRDTLEEGSKAYVKVVNKICQHNLRLIPRVVSGYVNKRKGISMTSIVIGDLLQQGYFGLRRAAEKFDATRGYTFSTYANSWVYQSVYRWHNAHDREIYIPENTMGEIYYRSRHGQPSKSKTGRLQTKVINAALRAMSVQSIDARITDDEEVFVTDTLSRENLLIDPTSKPEGEGEKLLRQLMTECGVISRYQEIVVTYTKRGNMAITAAKLSLSPKHCRNVYGEVVRKLKNRVEADAAGRLNKYLPQ